MVRITGPTRFTVWLALYGFASGVPAADRTKYYEIAGGSVAELRESLNRRRPRGVDGRPHDAVTKWDVRWRYRTAQAPPGCTMTSFKVTLDIVMTVPVWVNEADAPSSLVSRWREYDAALLAHENGHKGIAEAAAAAIQQAGASISPQSSCAEIGRLVDRIATSVLDQYREKERRYDAETGHGRTQGARFP